MVDETGVDFIFLKMDLSNGAVVPWAGGPSEDLEKFENRTAEFGVTTGGIGGPVAYQWRLDGVSLDPTVNPTAASSQLVIERVRLRMRACTTGSSTGENTCGSVVSQTAALTVLCLSDFKQNGVVSFFGLSVYLTAFSSGDFAADVVEPFGTLRFFDLAEFLNLFARGCP